MATSKEPKLVNGKWTLEVDPDDEVFYVADVSQWLIDNATTATAFSPILTGMTDLQPGQTPQGDRGGLLPVKLKFSDGVFTERSCTFRVSTADGQRFDKTMYFVQVQN